MLNQPISSESENLHGKVLTAETKRFLAKRVIDKELPATTLARLHNINYKTLMDYVQKVKSGAMLSDTRGRPNIIDDQSMQEVKTNLSGPIATRKDDFNNLMFEAAKNCSQKW